MALANVNSSTSAVAPSSTYKAALAVMTTLFFMWGFVTVLNDVLVPHLKSIFDLNYARVMLIQFSFFSAYFIFSIPSAKLIDWIGYHKTMVVGLFTMGVRCLSFHTSGKRGIVSAFSDGADDSGGRNYRVAGSGQSICCGTGSAGDSLEPFESGTSVQFAGNDYRTLSRRRAYPDRRSSQHGERAAALARGAAGVSDPRGFLGQVALRGNWRNALCCSESPSRFSDCRRCRKQNVTGRRVRKEVYGSIVI